MTPAWPLPASPPSSSCYGPSYAYWQRFYGRRPYDAEQSQVSDIITSFLEGIYPGIRGQIEVIDEATPLSYERYTGNWQGASTGWLLTRETMMR